MVEASTWENPKSRGLQVALCWQWLPFVTEYSAWLLCCLGHGHLYPAGFISGTLPPGCPREGDTRGSVLSHNSGSQQAGFLCGLLVTEGTELANTKFSVVFVQPSSNDKPDKFPSPRAPSWPCMGTGLGPSFQGHLRFPAHASK